MRLGSSLQYFGRFCEVARSLASNSRDLVQGGLEVPCMLMFKGDPSCYKK